MSSKLYKAYINYYSKPSLPLEAVLYLTDKCNLKCRICDIGLTKSHNAIKPATEISRQLIDTIMSAMSKLKVSSLYITGGEPLLADNLWYLLNSCTEHGISISGITTNGSLLNSLSTSQVNLLNAAKVNKLIISLDHAIAARHDEHRGHSGLFDNIIAFLRSSKAGALKTTYCFSTVVTRSNYLELSSIVNVCSSVKRIRHINFQPVCTDSIFIGYDSYQSDKLDYCIDEPLFESFESQMKAAIRLAKTLKISTTLPFLQIWARSYFDNLRGNSFFFNEVMDGYVCSKPYNYMHINYDGELLACTHIGTSRNIADGDMVEAWKEVALYYKEILRRGAYFPKCKFCYCDFGSNYRYSLLYKPFVNWRHINRLFYYYVKRYMNRT